MNRYGYIRLAQVLERVLTEVFVVLITGNSKSNHFGAQGMFNRGLTVVHLGLSVYTILSLPILYVSYCNTGWSVGNTILRNSVGDEGGEWGAQTRVFTNNSIDSLYKGLELNEYLVKANL